MSKRDKNKYVAAMLAYFFGGFGVHRFYLGDYGKGSLYLLFCWTLIPFIISFFEIFYFLFMSDDVFNSRYNGANALPNNAPRYALPAPNSYPSGQTSLQSGNYSMGYAGYSTAYSPSSPAPAGVDGSVAPASARSAFYNPPSTGEGSPIQHRGGGARVQRRDELEWQLFSLNRRRLDGEISEEQYLIENQRIWAELGR